MKLIFSTILFLLYSLSAAIGQTDKPIILENGVTLISGIPILVTGKKIHPDSISEPKIVTAGIPKTEPAHPNVHQIGTPKIVRAKPAFSRNLYTKQLQFSPHLLLFNGYLGDSSLTGIPIPSSGIKVRTVLPRPIEALPPHINFNAINNMRHLDVVQGLASSYIGEVFEDSRGNMWIGTFRRGVSMYNGTSYTHFTTQHGLIDNSVSSIVEDDNGNLWFSSPGLGVSMYDGESFTHFTTRDGLGSNDIKCMIKDTRGNIWFATYGGGVSKYDGTSFTNFTTREGLSVNYVWTIFEDKEGDLWFGTAGGGAIIYDGNRIVTACNSNKCKHDLGDLQDLKSHRNELAKSFTLLTHEQGLIENNIWSIVQDKNGNIWFGSPGRGASIFDGEFFTNFTTNEGLISNYINSIIIDKSGGVWFGTERGVCKYDGNSFTHFTTKDGLGNNFITTILEDDIGNLWLATYGGGVTIYDGRSFIELEMSESINTVRSIMEDISGNLWLGSQLGVIKYDGKTYTRFTTKEGLFEGYINSIIEDKSRNLWIATQSCAIKYDGKTFANYTSKEGLSSNYVTAILEDDIGNLWFATYGEGVSVYDGEYFTHFTTKEGLINNKVNTMLKDKNGNFWFGTEGGVTKYDGNSLTNYTTQEGLCNNDVVCIMEEKSGSLWFGTFGGGLSIYDGNWVITECNSNKCRHNLSVQKDLENHRNEITNSFTSFNTKDGLSDNIVWSIIQDNENNIWVGTESGLCVIKRDMQSKQTFKKAPEGKSPENIRSQVLTKINSKITTFNTKDGLKAMAFNKNSAFLDSKNRIWWGNGANLIMLDMNLFSLSNKPPLIQFNRLEINEQFVDYRLLKDSLTNGVTYASIPAFYNYPLNLELSYQKNHLTFFFSAIDWKAPHKIKYSYKIDPIDDRWSETSDIQADYRNLSHGKYTFKVRAIGQSQEWSEPFEYSFTIHPPWWHTWWARTGYGVSALLFILGFVRWRTAKLNQRQKELETEIEAATDDLMTKNKLIEKQKEVVEEAHKEITDSIAYAKRIQSAILPSARIVKEYLKESFILYKPKDVVAGDFYWMEPLKEGVLFAAADCTGHGVPGAMVSVVCNNALNRSVREYGLTDPGVILDKTREIVIHEFEKAEEEVKDGMDIALCLLNGNKLKYAGANNPLWIIRTGEIIETKANKQPIGNFDNLLPYTTHTFNLEKGDAIYIFSDGYVDQFGGVKGKKFKAKPFRLLLLSIQDKPMEQQRLLIDEAFENWKGNLEQIDDVCVIGVKI